MSSLELRRFQSYDRHQSYQWNYDHAPSPIQIEVPPVPGEWTFCSRKVDSPLGIAAGPLLNGRWCLYYAQLGFDVLTYKTVRSGLRACYSLPNLLPVKCESLQGGDGRLQTTTEFQGSWAVSFGMPSQVPKTWQEDIAETRRRLPSNKLLSVSVVGTMQTGWSFEQLAEDYAECALQATRHGADSIEINLSCPNVNTCDGQLYQHPNESALVAVSVRQAIGDLPLIVKIGHFQEPERIAPLIDALSPYIDAVATTNSVVASVIDDLGNLYFDGQPRGICGQGIQDASVRQTEAIAEYIKRRCLVIRIVGVGGIFTADDVNRYLSAGAESVQLATAPMIDPEVGIRIRRSLESMD
ncbi:hypothetical protein [Bythopirellula polymerisocia]|uniref:Dihydroorotate dehydrogenase B (NAD(+)), catalytic subunit n=1 Tax=Bythopirellula polymerisocia TaxID=2528003 RepID=A0A5C6CA38_9BACT|nr:hypothetical protein [Bythopirellula polymerisocia]TWU20351.1 Dihydroorotate dehydrogenase B (NAD(+)), catalytic subunit [Bythopirellula polymerisocia]